MKKQVLVMVLAAAGLAGGCKDEPKKTPAANPPTPPAAGTNGNNSNNSTNPSVPATMNGALPATLPGMPAILPATRSAMIPPSTRPSGSGPLTIGTSPSTQPIEFNK